MEDIDRYLNPVEKEMILLIEKIKRIVIEMHKINDIGEGGRKFMDHLTLIGCNVYSVAEYRYYYEQDLKEPSLSDEEKNELPLRAESLLGANEQLKRNHTGLEIVYYDLLHKGKMPEA